MVSVIVPVYNAERYLKFTLDSILNQTYCDFELICIDDGSTDESLNILKQYEQKDSRVRLFFSEDGTNYGVSHARNVGLDHAQGEYILFFDNDDLMEKDQIEIMINAIRQQNVQLVIGKYTIISPEGEKLRDEEVNEMEGRYYASEHLKELMWILPLLDSKLFLKELIDQHQLRFAKDVYAEDLGFYLKYLALCKQVYVIPRTVCRYRKLSTGITGRRKREIVQIYDMFQDVDSFYEKISVSQSAIGALYNIKLQHYWVHFQKYIDYTDRSDRKYVFHGLADAISDTAKKGKPFLSDFSWLIYQTIRKRKRWSLLYLSNLYVNYKNSIDSQ